MFSLISSLKSSSVPVNNVPNIVVCPWHRREMMKRTLTPLLLNNLAFKVIHTPCLLVNMCILVFKHALKQISLYMYMILFGLFKKSSCKVPSCCKVKEYDVLYFICLTSIGTNEEICANQCGHRATHSFLNSYPALNQERAHSENWNLSPVNSIFTARQSNALKGWEIKNTI